MKHSTSRTCQKRQMIVLGLIMVINFFLFYWPGFPSSFNALTLHLPLNRIPDIHLRFSPEEIYDFLTRIGPEGRQAFRLMHLTIDLSFPIVYSFFFFLTLKCLLSKTRKANGWLPFLALLAGVVDLSENFILNYLAMRYPVFYPNLTAMVEIITILKFTLIISVIAISIYFVLKSFTMPSTIE